MELAGFPKAKAKQLMMNERIETLTTGNSRQSVWSERKRDSNSPPKPRTFPHSTLPFTDFLSFRFSANPQN